MEKIFNSLEKKSHKWSRYMSVYAQYLERFKDTPITLVEVGVQNGGSLELWSKILHPKSLIIGIDIDPKCAKLQFKKTVKTADVQVVIGDQSNRAFWKSFLERTGGIDFFIDDGGHTMLQQIVTFEEVLPYVKPNGVYLCEDTHTSYYEWENAGYKNPDSFIEYTKNLVDVLHIDHYETRTEALKKHNVLMSDVSSVTYFDSMVVFDKRSVVPMHYIFSK